MKTASLGTESIIQMTEAWLNMYNEMIWLDISSKNQALTNGTIKKNLYTLILLHEQYIDLKLNN